MPFQFSSTCFLILAICLMNACGQMPSFPSVPGVPNPLEAAQKLQDLAGGAGASPGKCSMSGTSTTCCADIKIPKVNMKANTCVKLAFDLSNLKIDASLIFNGRTLFTKDLTKGITDLCQPLPLPWPASMLHVCLDIYYINIQPTSLLFEVCSAVSISRIVSVQFDCVKMSKGMISFNSDHSPQKYTVINVATNKGKPSFSLGRPSFSSFIPRPSFTSFFSKPAIPSIPSGLPNLSLPSLPTGIPSIPKLDIPSLPSLPAGIPSIPKPDTNLPSLPAGIPKPDISLPSLPAGIPKPDISLPSLPAGIPKPDISTPSIPSSAPIPSLSSVTGKLPGFGK